MDAQQINFIFLKLDNYYDCKDWWPASDNFEIMLGAILSQNTNWKNVKHALARLILAEALDPESILALPKSQLNYLLKPSGYYRQKSNYLREFCNWYLTNGSHKKLKLMQTDTLRQSLLSIHGIGPETADDILLYGFSRPIFVVDNYTRQLLTRLGLIQGKEGYETIRAKLQSIAPSNAKLLAKYHALIVEHGKKHCRKRPQCENCPLQQSCQYYVTHKQVVEIANSIFAQAS